MGNVTEKKKNEKKRFAWSPYDAAFDLIFSGNFLAFFRSTSGTVNHKINLLVFILSRVYFCLRKGGAGAKGRIRIAGLSAIDPRE